jgi:hypothetical protein
MLERFVRRVVLAPGLSVEKYAVAASGGEALLAESPNDMTYHNLLGMAQYRLEQCDKAIGNLEPAGDDAAQADGLHAVHRALFLAMAHFRIGHVQHARRMLAKAQELNTSSSTAHSKDTRALMAEAMTLVGQSE